MTRAEKSRLFSIVLFLFSSSLQAATEHLILIGGGKRPREAMSRFVEHAGREKARILIVAWATSWPEESSETIRNDLMPFHPASVENAPTAETMTTKKDEFLKQLSKSTGVFFTGGDQNRIMDVLKDTEILKALRAHYTSGNVFGGTSAGTAIMSLTMITGEGASNTLDWKKTEVREGLGLLTNVIVDQHFIRRQRQNRLFSLILHSPDLLGIGIDEDSSLAVDGNRHLEVLGHGTVMLVDGHSKDKRLVIELLTGGERFDLELRARPSLAIPVPGIRPLPDSDSIAKA